MSYGGGEMRRRGQKQVPPRGEPDASPRRVDRRKLARKNSDTTSAAAASGEGDDGVGFAQGVPQDSQIELLYQMVSANMYVTEAGPPPTYVLTSHNIVHPTPPLFASIARHPAFQ